MVSFSINLTGGGARGAYQAGVLLALSEILRDLELVGEKNPIRNWCGVSAGSINAVYCVTGVGQFHESARKLVDVWSYLKPEQVYRTDALAMGRNSVRWIRDLTFGPLFSKKLAHSLLDTEPLWNLVTDGIEYSKIQKNIAAGLIDGFACSAYSYTQGKTVTFIESKNPVSWDRARRVSLSTKIRPHHIMASCAIPIVFPSVAFEGEAYGDGAFRSTTPISPSIHMGDNKILMVGVRGPTERPNRNENLTHEKKHPKKSSAEAEVPGIAKLAGSILNALFFDTFDIDLERVRHMNEILKALKKDVTTDRSDYTFIDTLVIQPSRDISAIAEVKAKEGLPGTVDFMLNGLGSRHETAELASYILFEPSFTRSLIELGYQDVKNARRDIERWMQSPPMSFA